MFIFSKKNSGRINQKPNKDGHLDMSSMKERVGNEDFNCILFCTFDL